MKLNAYLTFNGNCAQAFAYYAEHLGGHVVASMTFGDAPEGGGGGPEAADKIMHACLMIGEQALMGSDAVTPYCPYEPLKGVSIALHPDSAEEAERLFAALSANGKVEMPLQQTFWATRFGSCTDQFGVPWMVNYMEAEKTDCPKP
ncbi:VOC family protein [Tahibacter caeni]|uniref:VOC family protein n=1 Tax=Tahibacter caeni TaxID=1453545 RepID=UPI0021488D97|nr:VOC family protein [Tahibacter caeni]